jgi:hypothetical protein
MYGHLWEGVRGLIIDAGAERTLTYVASSLYNHTASNKDSSVAGMLLASEQPRESGYIKRVSMSKLCAMPTEVGGSNSTYYSDYFWTNVINSDGTPNSQGLRCRLCGCSAYTGTNAGAFDTYASDAVAIAYQNVSAPLCFFSEDPVMQ